jgi:tetratricopeptide (TPR) repeat protein
MRLAVVAAVSAIALAHAAGAAAQDPTPTPSAPQTVASAPQAAASAPQAQRDDPDELARWFYAVLSGEMAVRTGDPGMAYVQLLQAARDMDSAELYQRAAAIALGAGAPQKALDAVNAWRAAQPASAQAQDWAAQLLVALGRNADAASAMTRRLALTPAPLRGDAILELTPLLGTVSPPKAAVELARHVLQPYAGWAQAQVVIGALQDRAGDRAAAFAAAAQALRVDPGLPAAALLLLRNYTYDAAQADALMPLYLTARPGDTEMRLGWIQVALDASRTGVALRQAQALNAAQPEVADAWLVRGSLLLDNGDAKGAQDALRRYLTLLQRDERTTPQQYARAYLTLAAAASKLGDPASALAWLQQIAPGVDDDAVRESRASAYAAQGRMDEAQQLLRGLPSASAAQRRARLLARAALYEQHSRSPEAWKLLRAGLKANADNAVYVYQTAMAAQRSGDAAAMERLLRGLVKSHPDDAQALNALGYTLADSGRELPEARRLIERALQLDPGNPFIVDSLGWLEFRSGNLPRAQQLLEQAWAARPDPEIGAHLGEVLWHAGERDRARALLLQVHRRAAHDAMIDATLERLGIAAGSDARH